jgi:Uma2 family endonuclease
MSSIATPRDVFYPDSDGQPMADNTLQFEWISLLKWGLEDLFADRPDVFVAGDLLWYSVEGEPGIRQAPDTMVAFGRPKGYRGSYRQWVEGGIAPQVVFEVWSPGNDERAMEEKRAWYARYGVEEYYLVYPDFPAFAKGWQRLGDDLVPVPEINTWVSPRLGIRFELQTGELYVVRPDGRRLQSYLEVSAQLSAERQRAEQEKQRAEHFAAKLRELGIDPNQL